MCNHSIVRRRREFTARRLDIIRIHRTDTDIRVRGIMAVIPAITAVTRTGMVTGVTPVITADIAKKRISKGLAVETLNNTEAGTVSSGFFFVRNSDSRPLARFAETQLSL